MTQAVLVPTSAWAVERRPGGWVLGDAVVGALCWFALAEEILFGNGMTPRGGLLAAAGLISVPLAWRRVRPTVTGLLSSSGYLVTAIISRGEFPPQLAVLPLLVAVYSAASRVRGRGSFALGAATLALMVTSHLVTPDGDPGDFWPWLLWGGAWSAGTFVRRRSDIAARHAARAALLEAEARTTAMESAQRERDRIARELHDVVAHAVSVMVVQAGAERLRLGDSDGPTVRVLTDIEESGRRALSELRAMLGVLRATGPDPDPLSPLPGLADLPLLVERLRATGLCIELEMVGAGGQAGTSEHWVSVDLVAYRIVQESLTNVVRHAALARTAVSVVRSGGFLELEIRNAAPTDPGAPEPGPVVTGRGLIGMRERAVAVGGTFSSGRADDGGYVVRASLPLHASLVGAP